MRKYVEDYQREAIKKTYDVRSVASVSCEIGVSESVLPAVVSESPGAKVTVEMMAEAA